MPEPQTDSDDETESVWLRRAWQRLRGYRWAHNVTVAGTALGAIAAIGGLFAQATATYYDAAVSDDQLQQSREDNDREQRGQASQVTFWTEDFAYGPSAIHVVNRSPDSISSVELTVAVGGGAERYLLTEYTTLGPCAEITYSAEHLLVMPTKDPDPDAKPWPVTIDGYRAERLYFVDSRGRGWVRSLTGLSEGTEKPDKTWQGALQVDDGYRPQVKKADPCSSDSP